MKDKDILFLALDCGGTKTRARLTNIAGDCLGHGLSGPANAFIGLDVVFKQMIIAANLALIDAKRSDITFDKIYVGLGMAGLSSGRLRQELREYNHPFASLRAETDAHIAQLGAFNGGDGAVLITGTGSCGYANIDGKIFIKGGNGFNISDHGSGAYLGRIALRRALQGYEGILPYTSLCKAIMVKFDQSIDKLVDWADKAKPVDYGKFTPIIFSHAKQDVLAKELIRQTAQEIDIIISVLLNLGSPSVALVGGMSVPLMPWLSDKLKPYLTKPLGDALDGARLLALDGFYDRDNNA